ncbi:11240_t:CDS:2 [Entrophospora sp. SA101]|nr:11240_t:CDS:2 [Entrophospora sp. SA101]
MSSSYLDLVDKSTELENSKVRVYAKTAVNSCVVTQMVTCALRSHQCKDILFVKPSGYVHWFISRFKDDVLVPVIFILHTEV